MKKAYSIVLSLLLCMGLLTFSTGCTKSPANLVAYVNLAVDTAAALAPLIPGLAPIVPYLQVAQAGLAGWQPGMPVSANVIAALQSALAQAEQSFNISPALKAELAILIAALITALQLAGVTTAAKAPVNPYAGRSANWLRNKFNEQAAAAGVKTI